MGGSTSYGWFKKNVEQLVGSQILLIADKTLLFKKQIRARSELLLNIGLTGSQSLSG